MIIRIFDDKLALANAAADRAAAALHQALTERGHARIIAATGASQFEFLNALTARRDIDWAQVEMFHLDEYIGLPAVAGLPADHPASFRKFLRERLIARTGITQFHFLDVESDPEEVAREVGAALNSAPVDVAFLGIGENGHLAFNDPPADFETEQPYLIVNLDLACRRQQVGEGWFPSIEEVPTQAISMSIRQILKANEILVIVPDARKAQAVKACFEADISPLAPASILRNHPNTTVYLDRNSSALISR
ncbi:MAG TPA: glucosamine-6-phosphate deaminase [Terracidiphilus sp.]|nr:glucosamine-6-phosphate deaminase [Terracidiphilus sp.]